MKRGAASERWLNSPTLNAPPGDLKFFFPREPNSGSIQPKSMTCPWDGIHVCQPGICAMRLLNAAEDSGSP
jgi:hypothetical protein